MESRFWSIFETTGRVEDYLRYREMYHAPAGNLDEGESELSRRKRTSEETVWERPSR